MARAKLILGLSAFAVLVPLATVGSLFLAMSLGVHARSLLALCTLPALGLVGWFTRHILAGDAVLGGAVSFNAAALAWAATLGGIALMAFAKGDAASGVVVLLVAVAVFGLTKWWARHHEGQAADMRVDRRTASR